MLRVADRAFFDDGVQDMPTDTAPLSKEPMGLPAAPVLPASRYGARRMPNMPVIGMIVLVHVLALIGLMQVRQYQIRHEDAKLSVVNLMPPPPPPPASETPPPPSKPVVVAPAPIVQTPVPTVHMVQTTPDPTPAPPAPSAPPAPPVPIFAPPSVISGGDLSAQMVAGKPPRYPIESRRKREQGTVLLSLTLGLDGAVEVLSIARSSGFSRLDDAARDAVRRWRWRPTVQNGQPVRVKGVVEIPFVLSA